MAIQFPMKHALSALVLATLGITAGSAFAQSTEYRRGYDQGYRDGVEATNAQAQPAPTMGRISIVDAQYGTREARCDAGPAIQQIASRRRTIDVTVNNNLCGDPAPNRTKRLSVTFRCGDGPEQRVSGPEGRVLAISCR